MDWYEQPAQAPPAPPALRAVTGIRRGIVTAVLAAGLLGVGGAAAVLAASPDPSAAPNATTQPSTNGGTPSGTAAPRHKGNCPNMGGSGGGSPNGTTPTPNSSGAPSSSGA
jgi:hypothetical protein